MPRSPKRTTKAWNFAKLVDRSKPLLKLTILPFTLLRRYQLTASKLLKKLRTIDRLGAIALLLAWFVIILAYCVPIPSNFDGSFLSSELSFTHAGNQEALLLDAVEKIQKIDLKGSQQIITLKGNFSSLNNSKLNAKLKKNNQITLNLNQSESRFIVETTKNSELSLNELRIQPQTNIQRLTYTSKPATLSLCLQTQDKDCLFIPKQKESKEATIAELELQLGTQPLTLTLTNFTSPELGTQSEQTLQYIPQTDTLYLQLASPTRIAIDLPVPTKKESILDKIDKSKDTDDKSKDIDLESVPEWVWGDLDVRNVEFFRSKINPSKREDSKILSTILEGKIRVQNQILELQPQQFLILPSPELGITKIRDIRVDPKFPQALRTNFTGTSTRIAAGHYFDFPIQELKLNLLSKLPPEAITSAIALITVLTSILVPRIFPEPSKKP